MNWSDEWGKWAVGTLTTILVIVGGWWKGRGIVRKDIRFDKEGERLDEAGEFGASAYQKIIKDLEAHIIRLDSRVAAAENRASVLETRMQQMSQRITDEISARYLAESEARNERGKNAGLKARIEELEEKLQLGSEPRAQGKP